jgi:carboxypeptidase family protein
MRKQVVVCLFGVLGMSSTFYAITPFQPSDQEIVAGCGVVKGRVVNETGHPVAGAKVSSMITDRPPRGRLMSSLTDAQGKFTLTCAQPGSNRVYVSKEDQYYPDTFLSPFVDAELVPIVNVVEQGITESVEVHLPPRGGKVVAQVIDAATQQPVDGANMTFCKADNPSKCLKINATSPDAHFNMALPSIRLTVKVSAPGYEDWYYKEGKASLRTAQILLTPGSAKRLTILLRPKANRSTKTKL